MKYLLFFLLIYTGVSFAQVPDSSQYQSLLTAYLHGDNDYNVMPFLARIAKKKGEKHLADSIGQDYVDHYLSKLDKQTFLTRENITTFEKLNTNSNSQAFKLFCRNTTIVDRTMGHSGYAKKFCDFFIYQDNIRDKIWQIPNKVAVVDPDWKTIEVEITKKYGHDYAERTILDAHYGLAKFKRDSVLIWKYGIQKYSKAGADVASDGGEINNFCYYFIFQHCDDRKVLRKAISWMKVVTKTADPVWMNYNNVCDTYAELLFKYGFLFKDKTTENRAISVEKGVVDRQALSVEKGLVSVDDPVNHGYEDDYDKIKSGTPFWSSAKY